MLEDNEGDSLFGSPPPSPARGRSPAFISEAAQQTGISITQNVGTIALPGSHMSCSELPGLPLGRARSHTLPLQSSQNVLRKQNTSTPCPEPPPITHPDPEKSPLPSHVSRSQQASLGIAGSTPHNPIIVEELDPMRFAQFSPLPPVHPHFTHITAPPPFKRRKLTTVPAGAVDWDVPYPFPEGEGPEAYHASWERERAKQLITQLLELTNDAVQGAAAKKHTPKPLEARKMLLGHPMPDKSSQKKDILQRARELRRQIVAEIERAKVELWEVSIEGGVLGHMVKDPTLS